MMVFNPTPFEIALGICRERHVKKKVGFYSSTRSKCDASPISKGRQINAPRVRLNRHHTCPLSKCQQEKRYPYSVHITRSHLSDIDF